MSDEPPPSLVILSKFILRLLNSCSIFSFPFSFSSSNPSFSSSNSSFSSSNSSFYSSNSSFSSSNLSLSSFNSLFSSFIPSILSILFRNFVFVFSFSNSSFFSSSSSFSSLSYSFSSLHSSKELFNLLSPLVLPPMWIVLIFS